MERDPKTSDQGAAAPPEITSLVGLLAAALKNIAIYPADHPRVATAATEFLTGLQGRADGRRTLVYTTGEQLVFDRVPTPPTDGKGNWLMRRFRDAGLRGLEFAPDCTATDLVAFAQALQRVQPRHGNRICGAWPPDHPRLRALDLVYSGFHGELDQAAVLDTGDEAQAGANANGAPTGPHDVGAVQKQKRVLARLAGDLGLREQLKAIERGCAVADDESHRSVDMLTAITELMPVDIAADPEQAAAVVAEILGRIERDLQELSRRNAQVRGADLLRRALAVARKYFVAEAPSRSITADLPSGRPEDERITADLDQLLAEVARLPDAELILLPAAEQRVSTAPLMARQLLGIFLYLFTHSERPHVQAALRPILAQRLQNLDEAEQAILQQYLRPRSDEAAVGEAQRRRLFEFLIEHGRGAMLRELGYVDAVYVTRGFPETLPLAARVLGGDPAGRKILLAGIEALAPVLEIGGIRAAVASGVLADEPVVAALAAIGGQRVLPLLVPAAADSTPATRLHLIAYARTRDLPPPELALLRHPAAAAVITSDYVRELYECLVRRRVPQPLRTTTHGLLRAIVERGFEELAEAELLAAIDNLRHAPDAATVALLRQLAAHRRFTNFSGRLRAVRRTAKDVLATMPIGEFP